MSKTLLTLAAAVMMVILCCPVVATIAMVLKWGLLVITRWRGLH